MVTDKMPLHHPNGNSIPCIVRLEAAARPVAELCILLIMYDYEISVHDASRLLKTGQAKLIDVREPWENAIAKVDGCRLIPMGEFAARAHQELDPDDHMLILCHHGARSLSVTNWLRQQGFDATQSVAGGIDAWSREVDPSIAKY